MKAQELGIAGKRYSYDELLEKASIVIRRSRAITQSMMANGFIPEAPEE
jgi:hypothetical protein